MNYKSLNTLIKLANKFASHEHITLDYDLELEKCKQDSHIKEMVTCPATIKFISSNGEECSGGTKVTFRCGFGNEKNAELIGDIESQIPEKTEGGSVNKDNLSVGVDVTIDIDTAISNCGKELSKEKLQKELQDISTLMAHDFMETKIFKGIERDLFGEEEQGAMQDERDERREDAELREPSPNRSRITDRRERFNSYVDEEDEDEEEMPF
jgi:hypothetical protein